MRHIARSPRARALACAVSASAILLPVTLPLVILPFTA
jgi:type IV secretion system protein TrbJ